MANTLRFKRGLVAGIPTGVAGEPLFTTDTFDLYIGNGTTNTRFQKYIASGTTAQYLRGDGSLATFPTNIVTGTGTTNYLPKFTGASTLGNSLVYDNGTGIGVNAITDVSGVARLFVNYSSADSWGLIVNNTYTATTNNGFFARFYNNGTQIGVLYATNATSDLFHINGNNGLRFLSGSTAGTERARITSGGNFIINNASTDNGLRFQVTGDGYFSGSVGIGIAPSYKLDVLGDAHFGDGNSFNPLIQYAGSGRAATSPGYSFVGDLDTGMYNPNSVNTLAFSTAGVERARLDSSGNLGLGVTPSAFESGFKVFQFGNTGVLANNTSDLRTILNSNSFNNSAGSATYLANGFATQYMQISGSHRWYQAPSGTAGNAITFTQAMTLFANGNLAVGTSTDSGYKLDVNGTGRFSGQVRFGTGLYIDTNGDFYQPFLGQIQISGVAGNITYPSYGFYGDTGIGMYRESADTLAFVTSGVKALTIASTGAATFSSSVTASSLVKSGGTSTQYLMADGSTSTLTNPVTGTGTTNYLPKFTGTSTIGNSAFYDGGGFGGFNSVGLANRTFVIQAATSRPLAIELIENANVHAVYVRPNNSGFNLISSNYISGGVYIPLALSGRENNTDLVLATSGNVLVGTTTDAGYKLDVNGTMKVTGASTFGGYTTITNTGGGAFTSQLTLTNSTSSPSLLAFTNTVNGFAFGFNSTTTQRFVFLNGSIAEIASISGTGAGIFNDSVTANLGLYARASGVGYASLLKGNATNTGFLEFYSAANVRQAYIGFSSTTATSDAGTLPYVAGTHAFSGAATFSSSVTAASGIITGNLTVDTNTLFVDATNNRVGIGTVIPLVDLQVQKSSLPEIRITDGTIGYQMYATTGGDNFVVGTYTNHSLVFRTNAVQRLSIDTTGAATFSSSIEAATAIAIGTTPDTNKPFKILKNINATVGINFENTSTGSSAFSAIQMGTDVTGGTAFTNLVYGSSGISEAGVYKPSGTSLVNTGSGGLNFLAVSQPIRFFTSSGNGTLRASITNDGDYTQFNGTNPSASTTDAFRMYSADVVAGNAAPHFRTENGAVVKIYQETTGVGNAIFSAGGGNSVLDDSTFDGYTLRQIVKALRNQGILA